MKNTHGYKKFVKTLNGIYDVEGSTFYTVPGSGFKIARFLQTTNGCSVNVDEIIEESENILDLVDCLVLVGEKNRKVIPATSKRMTIIAKDADRYINNYAAVYGAIWTQEGLRYVAKLTYPVDKEPCFEFDLGYRGNRFYRS